MDSRLVPPSIIYSFFLWLLKLQKSKECVSWKHRSDFMVLWFYRHTARNSTLWASNINQDVSYMNSYFLPCSLGTNAVTKSDFNGPVGNFWFSQHLVFKILRFLINVNLHSHQPVLAKIQWCITAKCPTVSPEHTLTPSQLHSLSQRLLLSDDQHRARKLLLWRSFIDCP